MKEEVVYYEEWYVSEDYLPEALKKLDEDGVDMLCVFIVPSLKDKKYYKILYKKIIYGKKKNE